MTKKEILQAAEENSMNYCIQRGMAKAAFIDGALWALKKSKELLENIKSDFKVLYDEKLNSKRDLVCEIDNGMLLIYYKDDNSVVKKMSVSDILVTKNDE